MFPRFIFRDIIYVIKSKINGQDNYKKKESHKLFWFIIFIVLVFFCLIRFEKEIRPTVITLAEARAKVIATTAINTAINEEIVSKIKYEDLIILQKDEQQRITALQANIVKMNEIQAHTSLVIQKKLSNIQSDDLNIPFGNLYNSSILAGWGPKVKIKIQPVGTIQSKFITDFINAGINQTKHKVSLEVQSKISIVVPLISTNYEITTNIPIAETVIVGGVPQTYLDVSGTEDKNVLEKARGIAPNLATN